MARQTHIEGLRGVAVLAVVLYHLGVPGFSGGFVGVDLFFVISGFLITRLIRDEIVSTGRFRFGHFYMRRVARLFPALFFTLLVSTAVAAALFPPDRLRDYGASLAAASLSVANVWFWSQAGYFDTASITKPLLHTWSLAIEEQFYLVWPVLLLAIARSRVRSVVFLSVAFCLSLGWNVDLVYGGSAMTQGVSAALRDAFTDYRAAIYFLLPFRVFEFVIGAGLVWVATKPGRGTASAITAAGIGLVAIPIVAYTERTVFPSVAALAPCIGAAALIYAGASTPLGRLFDNRLVVPVGSISYSLYLIHWPAIVFYRYWKDAPRLSTLDQAGILVFCIVGAALMYKFVEQPFRRPDTGTSWLPRRRLAPLAVACTAGLVVIGTSAYTSADWWWRYPPEIRTLLETDVFY